MGPAAVLLLLWSPQALPPSSAADWKAAGVAEVGAQRMDAAAAAFGKACELDPKDEDACYFFGRTLSSMDQWEKARDPFEKALRAASPLKLARVHRAIALNFIGLGDTASAERHFKLAIDRNPGPDLLREDPRVDYGAFLFRQGRLGEALPLLNEAVRAAPRSARAHTELGRVALHLGSADAAVASLETAVNLDPRSSAARLLHGRAYLEAGRVDEGQKQLRLARETGTSTVK